MSTTYTLLCHDCRKQYWAAQSSGSRITLYENTGNFLRAHMGHKLGFVCDFGESPYLDEYQEVTDKELKAPE